MVLEWGCGGGLLGLGLGSVGVLLLLNRFCVGIEVLVIGLVGVFLVLFSSWFCRVLKVGGLLLILRVGNCFRLVRLRLLRKVLVVVYRVGWFGVFWWLMVLI